MADTDGEGTDGASLTRRHVVVGAAGAAVGGAGGVAIFSDGLFSDAGGTSSIEKQEPNDDGEASLGELHWLLEENPQTEYTVDVTQGTYDIHMRVATPLADRELRVLLDGVDLAVDEELDSEERISSVMREVRSASDELRYEGTTCPNCGHEIGGSD